ncbi:hypothetical protein BBSC_0538 [Bifidobacterium scardovii JCM 12489 = DSM 13734]|nr:hypothetical protein BBSC_0538 [Bifidobacterium scardovii JCM 12489 = DSM 13734]
MGRLTSPCMAEAHARHAADQPIIVSAKRHSRSTCTRRAIRDNRNASHSNLPRARSNPVIMSCLPPQPSAACAITDKTTLYL